MFRSKLTACLALILFLMAGLVEAAHPEKAEPPSDPCPKMAAMADHQQAINAIDHEHQDDCDLECNCCPGSCSSSVGLLTNDTWGLAVSFKLPSTNLHAHPERDTARLLRPPISA